MTTAHNALLTSLRSGLAGELVALRPMASGTRLIDVNSLRSSTKLVLMILLLLVEEGLLGLPGGSQVAFFATFFASTGNLGRQNKTDLVGLAGLLVGFAYGVVAAFLTSRLPQFPLLLALVFLGEFLANLAFQTLPRYGVAGMQAGLALPFAYLATTGPEWGSFTTVQTRFAGLVIAGFTAVVIHAYLWPVLPMRHLRALIAAALRDTATSLRQLFGAPRSTWRKAPPTLGETVRRASDLLDDARYLPGPDHADPAYQGILSSLQEIDANLEYCISSSVWRQSTRCGSIFSKWSAITRSRPRETWSGSPSNYSSPLAARLASNRYAGSRMPQAAGSARLTLSDWFRIPRSIRRDPR